MILTHEQRQALEQADYDREQRGMVGDGHDWRVKPDGSVVLNYHTASELEALAKRAVQALVKLKAAEDG